MVGERCRHHGGVARGDEDRTLPEIDIEHIRHVVDDHAIGAQQITDRPVAIARRALGRIDRLVDVELAAGEAAKRLADVCERAVILGGVDQAGAGDRAGIDHRVEGVVFRIQPDRVEGIARRLDADHALDPFGTQRVQRQREHERFRHRLDSEGDIGVADLVDMAVEGREADAKMGRVGLAELGNVVGDRAAGLGQEICVTSVQKPQQRRLRAGPGRGGRGDGRRRSFHRLSLCNAIKARATGSEPELGDGSA